MSESTLNLEGVLAPSSSVRSPLLRALLVQEAEVILAQKYPLVYYEPEMPALELPDRELTDEEELYRLQQFAVAALEHERALQLWRAYRQRFIDLEVSRLYRSYRRRSLDLERLCRRTDLAAGLKPWLRAQYKLGHFALIEARMFMYLMLKEVAEDAEGAVAANDSWGAESFQAYIDHLTAVYDGGDVTPVVDAMNLYRCRAQIA